jgi:hypothetical protein
MPPHARHKLSSPGLRLSSFQRLASHFVCLPHFTQPRTQPRRTLGGGTLGGGTLGGVLHAERSASTAPVLVAGVILLFCFACSSARSALPPTLVPLPPTSASDNPTAGAARRATQAAAATRSAAATQHAAASQTAQVAAQATQTAQAASTVQALATGQAVLAAKGAWPQRLLETFADNQLGWPTGLTADHSLSVTASLAGGQYQWVTRVINGNSYFNLVPSQGPVFSNFFAQVSITFGAGNDGSQSAYGLVFRQVKDDYGFFGVLKDGGVRLLEVHGSGIYQLIETSSTAFDASLGASNRLGVVAVGPDFVFLINDHEVGQMTADLAPGQIGLGIDTLARADTAQVDFSQFQIDAP